ncbi:EF-hand domain [Trinorchestia longiramus]|nr:EF-hand domain [Trinorchestia longiramus]
MAATVVEWYAARVLYRVSACAERLRAGSKPGNEYELFLVSRRELALIAVETAGLMYRDRNARLETGSSQAFRTVRPQPLPLLPAVPQEKTAFPIKRTEDGEMPEVDPEQMLVLKRAFDSFDQEKRGAISTDIVATILKMMGQTVNRQILKQVIEEVDVDGSGELEFNEFVMLATKFMNEEDEEEMKKELKEAFRLYDKNGEGFIPTEVLREILKELDDKLTDEELDGMVEEIDADGSGTVDFDEFMDMMTGE